MPHNEGSTIGFEGDGIAAKDAIPRKSSAATIGGLLRWTMLGRNWREILGEGRTAECRADATSSSRPLTSWSHSDEETKVAAEGGGGVEQGLGTGDDGMGSRVWTSVEAGAPLAGRRKRTATATATATVAIRNALHQRPSPHLADSYLPTSTCYDEQSSR